MNSSSGIAVNISVKSEFQSFKSMGKWMKIMIENEKIVVKEKSNSTGSLRNDFNRMRESHEGSKSVCYFLLKTNSSKFCLILFCPTGCALNEKFVYSSTLGSLKNGLGSSNFNKTLTIEGKLSFDDFDLDPKRNDFMTEKERYFQDYDKHLPQLVQSYNQSFKNARASGIKSNLLKELQNSSRQRMKEREKRQTTKRISSSPKTVEQRNPPPPSPSTIQAIKKEQKRENNSTSTTHNEQKEEEKQQQQEEENNMSSSFEVFGKLDEYLQNFGKFLYQVLPIQIYKEKFYLVKKLVMEKCEDFPSSLEESFKEVKFPRYILLQQNESFYMILFFPDNSKPKDKKLYQKNLFYLKQHVLKSKYGINIERTVETENLKDISMTFLKTGERKKERVTSGSQSFRGY